MWQTMGSPESLTIIELGPGRGLFAVDVLAWVKRKFPEFYRALTYSLVETSASLRERLHQRFEPELEPRTANHGSRVTIHDSLESSFQASSESVIVFGNEFFDALPTEVLDYRCELRIDVEDGRCVERF